MAAIAAAMCPLAQAQSSATTTNTAPALDEVIVVTPRTGTSPLQTPASLDVVDGDDMRDAQAQVNLSESLGGVPGLQLQNRQNYAQDLQLSIRGFGARSTFGIRGIRLYVDGIPATMPDGQGQLSNIDIASIDHVEVMRGPFSALYGNSAGGVINVFTEDGTAPPTVTTNISGGSYGSVHWGLKASGAKETTYGPFEYVVSANRFTTEGFRDHSAARRNLANAKLSLHPDSDSQLTLVLNSVDTHAQDPMGLTRAQWQANPRGAVTPAYTFNTRKDLTQTQGGLTYERRLGGNDTLLITAYAGTRSTTQYQSIPVATQASAAHPGGVIDLDRDYAGVDVRWTAQRQLANRSITWVTGLSYDSLREDRQGYQNFQGSGGTAPATLGVTGALRRNETNTLWNLDPYAQASWHVTPKWTLDAGLRYTTVSVDSADHYIVAGNGDDSGSARYRKALPVVAVRYAAGPETSLYASAGRGFETPTMNEASYRPDGEPGLNFGLRPSTNTSVEIGAKTAVGNGFLTAALFQTRTEDEIIVAAASDGRTSYMNGGRTRRNGLELSWNNEFGGHWHTQLAYTLLDATFRDSIGNGNIATGARIPGTARQAAFASIGWQPPRGWRAGAELRALSRIAVNNANSEFAPGYVVAALSLGYRAEIGRWTVAPFARIDNLFDRNYVGSVIVNDSNGRYYEPAPGRNWTAGVTASYAF